MRNERDVLFPGARARDGNSTRNTNEDVRRAEEANCRSYLSLSREEEMRISKARPTPPLNIVFVCTRRAREREGVSLLSGGPFKEYMYVK